MKVLVVGRGMLGGAVLRGWPEQDQYPTPPIEWSNPPLAREQLAELAASFGRSLDGPWRLAWCAGAGVVGTSVEQLRDEQSYLESFLAGLHTANLPVTSGAIFLASSAGGAFGAGSSDWISERSHDSPISPYGESKIAQERIFEAWADDLSVPFLVGRISNLYGPGQNMAKSQGFISQLLRSMLIRRPFRLGVSGDTQRDFIHVDDAAARINAWMHLQDETTGIHKLIATGQSYTLVRVANIVRAVTRIQPRIMYASTPGSALQPRHLRFASVVRTEIDSLAPCRPLEIGISETWQAMLRSFAVGAFA